MRILLLGYGKMGKTIEQIALKYKHIIVERIDISNREALKDINSSNTDVAIEFSQPDAVYDNLKFCIENQIPVVCGTTGWLEKKEEIEKYCLEKNSALFYSSNYSIGVNIFFQLNKILAKLMNDRPEYNISMVETHHIYKLDSPSGTAITLAEGVIKNNKNKTNWENDLTSDPKKLYIQSIREGEVPGIHLVKYESSVDLIEIKHEAFNRMGFAEGAVVAAQWLVNQKGVFGMDDLLSLK